jgi:hypothetical protein
MNCKISIDPIPIILIENFLIPTEEEKENILNNIFEAKSEHEKLNNYEKNYYSYPIKNDSNNYLKKLYNNYLLFCFKTFGNFQISKRNNSTCWAYCSNQKDFNSFWHDHIQSSSINAVYYINIPKDSGGPLFFRIPKNDNEFEIYSYFPKNYDLIIFPNYLEHKPMPPSSDDYRICINMEIICENDSPKNIFKKVFPHLFPNKKY